MTRWDKKKKKKKEEKSDVCCAKGDNAKNLVAKNLLLTLISAAHFLINEHLYLSSWQCCIVHQVFARTSQIPFSTPTN